MIAELLNSISSDVVMGIAQAAVAIAICLAVVVLCRRFAVLVERETITSLARGLVQMVAVGVVLAVLLHGSLLIGALILLAMTFAAAATASRRASKVRGALLLSFHAIAAGAGVVIAAMLATRTLTANVVVLVPVGSMCNERLRAIHGAVQSRRHGACGPNRSWIGARCRPCRDRRALRPERRLCQPASSSRHAEVARLRLDPGRHGRHARAASSSAIIM
jgi:hypothetical protein